MKWDGYHTSGENAATAWFKHTRFGILEKHYTACECSYCDWTGERIAIKKRKFGKKTPDTKAWNSWWYLYCRRGLWTYYFRYHSLLYKHTKPPTNLTKVKE